MRLATLSDAIGRGCDSMGWDAVQCVRLACIQRAVCFSAACAPAHVGWSVYSYRPRRTGCSKYPFPLPLRVGIFVCISVRTNSAEWNASCQIGTWTNRLAEILAAVLNAVRIYSVGTLLLRIAFLEVYV